MASELLERLVIRLFDETSTDYVVPEDDVVIAELPTKAAGGIKVIITDREKIRGGAELLTVVAPVIVKFPESRARRALDLCNALNMRPLGKFIVDSEGGVSYCLDWPVAKSAQPEDVTMMLSLAAATIEARYPVLMAARWGEDDEDDS